MRNTAFLLCLAGCYADAEVVPEEAIKLALCPDSDGNESDSCPAIADGHTAIPMRVCTMASSRPSKLDAVLTVPSGHWAGTTERAKTVSLAAGACADVMLVPPTEAGTLPIDVDVAGVRIERKLTLAAAPLDRVVAAADPSVLSDDTHAVKVRSQVSASNGGAASSGTTVRFAVMRVTPATALAVFQGERVSIDSDGVAVGTLVVASAVKGVDIMITATPPETAAPPSSVTASLSVFAP